MPWRRQRLLARSDGYTVSPSKDADTSDERGPGLYPKDVLKDVNVNNLSNKQIVDIDAPRTLYLLSYRNITQRVVKDNDVNSCSSKRGSVSRTSETTTSKHDIANAVSGLQLQQHSTRQSRGIVDKIDR